MSRWRKPLIVLAAAGWSVGAGIIMLCAMGIVTSVAWRLFHIFDLAVAITATLAIMINRHVLEPCRVYRLGWEARGRLEASHTADMEARTAQRRA